MISNRLSELVGKLQMFENEAPHSRVEHMYETMDTLLNPNNYFVQFNTEELNSLKNMRDVTNYVKKMMATYKDKKAIKLVHTEIKNLYKNSCEQKELDNVVTAIFVTASDFVYDPNQNELIMPKEQYDLLSDLPNIDNAIIYNRCTIRFNIIVEEAVSFGYNIFKSMISKISNEIVKEVGTTTIIALLNVTNHEYAKRYIKEEIRDDAAKIKFANKVYEHPFDNYNKFVDIKTIHDVCKATRLGGFNAKFIIDTLSSIELSSDEFMKLDDTQIMELINVILERRISKHNCINILKMILVLFSENKTLDSTINYKVCKYPNNDYIKILLSSIYEYCANPIATIVIGELENENIKLDDICMRFNYKTNVCLGYYAEPKNDIITQDWVKMIYDFTMSEPECKRYIPQLIKQVAMPLIVGFTILNYNSMSHSKIKEIYSELTKCEVIEDIDIVLEKYTGHTLGGI
jgi:hypothetical protein